jgi:four helix bundle protein
MKTNTFKDLIVWQKAYLLTLEIYKISTLFPKEERFGLSSQIRRAAVSIVSNIAEGYARNHSKEYRQFLAMAYGSLAELETQLLLVKDLKYIGNNDYIRLEKTRDEIGAMLFSMIRPERCTLPADI